MKIPILLMTLLLAVAGAQAQKSNKLPQSSSWEVYTPTDEEFSVALPVYPSMHTGKEKRENPQKDRRIRLLRASYNGVAYAIYVVENPEPRQSLDAFIQEQTSNPTLELTNAKDLTLDGITGKSFVYPDAKGMVQFFATKDRLYDFRAHGASLDDSRVAWFFTSLSFIKQDKSIEVFNGPGSFYETNPLDIYRGTDVDSKVRVHSKPEPSLTENDQIRGTVILRCIFRSNGTVTHFRVVKGLSGGLTEKAIEAAREIKFTPAMKDGKPVSMWMQLEYNFNR